jgi:hypothetical protein
MGEEERSRAGDRRKYQQFAKGISFVLKTVY